MKFYQKLDGGVHVSAREYDIAADTAIAEGQVVKLAEGLVVSAAAGETGAILGVAAENHSGQADAIDPRANGTKILVIDDPVAVFQTKAPEAAASAGGSSTTIIMSTIAGFANDDFNGGYVKLVSKTAESMNTDEIGTVRRITDFVAASGTFTVDAGGTPAEGDVYAVFPPVAFAKGNLNAARTGLVFTASNNLPLRVIGTDRALGNIHLAAKKHLFAVSA